MTDKQQPKNRPSFRLSFARKTGTDADGGDILGSAREIASVWARANSEGFIVRWDHLPIELTQHGGVTFMNPVKDEPNGTGGAR
jgi:hypothetical protein